MHKKTSNTKNLNILEEAIHKSILEIEDQRIIDYLKHMASLVTKDGYQDIKK